MEGEAAAVLAGELLDSPDGDHRRVVEVVDNEEGLVSTQQELEHGVAAHVAGATSDEDGARSRITGSGARPPERRKRCPMH